MFRTKKGAIALLGALWVIIGMGLLVRGYLLLDILPAQGDTAMLYILIGLFLGYLKRRLIMSKAADRGIERIAKMHEPLSFKQIFPMPYLALILVMVLFGQVAKLMPVSIRLIVCVAVGSALVNGSGRFWVCLFQRREA